MIKLISKDWVIENIDTIIFDKDGTFIDLHYFWGKITEMRADAIIHHYSINPRLKNSLCLFLGYDTKLGKMLPDGITALYSRIKIINIFVEKLSEIGINTTTTEVTQIFDNISKEFNKNIEKYTKPINSAIEFIKNVRKLGIKIGIVTSDSIETTKLTLKLFGWDNLFDCIIGRESSTETKESGIPTQIALKELNSTPKTTIMIGDAPMDSISAKNAGINHTILVATGQLSKVELCQHSSYVIETLKDLKCLKI